MSLKSKKALAKREFQKMIRLRDADESGYCTCCTCGKKYHYKELDAGHFIPSTYLSTCFDECNCHAQCKHCNAWKEGNKEEYFIFMEKRYGRPVVDQLIQRKYKKVKFVESDYVEMIKCFRKKQKEYLKKF